MKCKLFFFLYFSSIIIVLIFSTCAENPYRQGEQLYTFYCSSCHMEEGQGLRGLIPPLAGADYWKDNQDKLACIIKNGIEGEIIVNGKTYNQPMAGIEKISSFEIANIINYVNQSWGNDIPFKNFEDIEAELEICAPD